MPLTLSTPLSRSLRFIALSLTLSASAIAAQLQADLGSQTSSTSRWIGTWAAAQVGIAEKSGAVAVKEVLYQTVHLSRGGRSVRVIFTNEFGTDPLVLDAARISLRGKNGDPLAGSDHALSFVGKPGIVVPAGAVAVSDPVAMDVPALGDLNISLSLPPQRQHTITAHSLGLQTNYQAEDDTIRPSPPSGAHALAQWHFLKSVEVLAKDTHSGAAVVALGDSITDGYRSTTDTNRRWPDLLAERLQADAPLRSLGVLNEGISGNRVLHDGAGPSALARLDRDVLSQDGVHYLIVMESINDIGRAQSPGGEDAITAQTLIAGLTQIVERAHAHGILVYGATLTPFLGAGYASPSGEAMRQTVNEWIRGSRQFDGVIDFDQITRNPTAPTQFLPAYDSGDHLHPNDAGYKAMADGIDLKLFSRR